MALIDKGHGDVSVGPDHEELVAVTSLRTESKDGHCLVHFSLKPNSLALITALPQKVR